MANTTTLNEALRSPIDGTESMRLATAGANWRAPISALVGGAAFQVQYNKAGVFGGMSGTSWDDINRVLTLSSSGPGSTSIGINGFSTALYTGGSLPASGASFGQWYNSMALALNGSLIATALAVQWNFSAGVTLQWNSDVGISRTAASVLALGNGGAGDASATILAKTKAGVPTTADVPAGTWVLIRDTVNSTTKLYYNNAGTLQSVALV